MRKSESTTSTLSGDIRDFLLRRVPLMDLVRWAGGEAPMPVGAEGMAKLHFGGTRSDWGEAWSSAVDTLRRQVGAMYLVTMPRLPGATPSSLVYPSLEAAQAAAAEDAADRRDLSWQDVVLRRVDRAPVLGGRIAAFAGPSR